MRTKLAYGAVAVILFAAPAWAEAWDFLLTNDTGKTIKAIELSPAGAAAWQARILDEESTRDKSVAAGKRTTVAFDKAEKQCRMDIRLTFADDTTAVWPNVNVCDNALITFRYRNNAPVFAAN